MNTHRPVPLLRRICPALFPQKPSRSTKLFSAPTHLTNGNGLALVRRISSNSAPSLFSISQLRELIAKEQRQHEITHAAQQEYETSRAAGEPPTVVEEKKRQLQIEDGKAHEYGPATNATDIDNQRARSNAP